MKVIDLLIAEIRVFFKVIGTLSPFVYILSRQQIFFL